jgi:hypothetical protein
MTPNSNQNRGTAGDTAPGIEQPARRKLEVRRETLQDLTPETRTAGKIKGGIPKLTNQAAGPNFTRDV